MALKYETLEEAREELESLIGLGLYQAEAEPIKTYLRELEARYPGSLGIKSLRRRLDKALGSKELSQALRDMREEELH